MKQIEILDCTLRDGGYCNQWNFGYNNIKAISSGLIYAGVDIIECGFLTNKVVFDNNVTMFTKLDEISPIIPTNRDGRLFVCMINYNEYSINDIPQYDGKSVDGIRVAFHKEQLIPALKFCMEIKEKGYKVFIQPMVSLGYSDEEFINLIKQSSDIKPYAFYIVDSFGVMKRKDLIRLFSMVEHNLSEDIAIGYHSHNNMQLAYSNAQALVDMKTKHNIIIDSSILGMGRGAGNLNTELFVEYLNDNNNTAYNIKPLLSIIDEIINAFYQEKYWGYSLPNYLSAKHNIHPNYASYLERKNTLTVENMDEIFYMIDDSKRCNYDKDYIDNLYLKYMDSGHVWETNLAEFKEVINNKKVLIIAPGPSSIEEKDRIIDFAKKDDVVSISINFDYSEYETDYIFLSNNRRFKELSEEKHSKCIVTSNVPAVNIYLKTRYTELLNNKESVRDNAGMMLIKYLIQLGVKSIYIAGLDGYSVDPTQNYANQNMNFYTQKSVFEAKNIGMSQVLMDFAKEVKIEFITSSKFLIIK